MANRVQIVFEADASQANKVISSLNSSLGSIGASAFKAQQSSVEALSASMLRAVQLSDQLVRTGYRLSLGISAPIIAATSYIVKLGSEIESARISFEVLTGSIEGANRHLEDLQKFAVTTPFNFTQVISLSRFLQAAGIEAEKVIPLLRSVGNALAVTGGGNDVLERVVNQLVHIQNLGRVSLRELNPIARAGIPIFEELAEAIKKPGEAADETAKRLRALIRGGAIPGPEFLKFFQSAQNARFPEGLEKVGQVLRTQIANLVDATSLAAAKLGETLAPAISFILKLLTGLVQVINVVASAINLLPDPIKIVLGLVVAFGAAIGPLILGFGYLVRGLTSVFQLFSKLTGATALNTGVQQQANKVTSETIALKTGEAAATNAAAAAKLRYAEAQVLENKVVAPASSATAEQLLLFRPAKFTEQRPIVPPGGDPGKALTAARTVVPRYPPPLPRGAQASLPFSTSPFDVIPVTAADSIAKADSALTKFLGTLGRVALIVGVVSVAIYKISDAFDAFSSTIPVVEDIAKRFNQLGINFTSLGEIAGASFKVIEEGIYNIGKNVFGLDLGSLAQRFTGQTGAFAEAGNILGTALTNGFRAASNPLKFAIEQIRDRLILFSNELRKFQAEFPQSTIFNALPEFIRSPILEQINKEKAAREEATRQSKEAADKQLAEDSALLRAKLAQNEAQQEYAKLLQLGQQAERQARESRIAAEGKELSGFQQLNAELDKYIDRLSTAVVKDPRSNLTHEVTQYLSAPARLDVFRGYLAEVKTLSDKNGKEIAADAYKIDEEAYKIRLSQLDEFSKARITALEAANSAELISFQELSEKRAAIEQATIQQRSQLEIDNLKTTLTQQTRELEVEKSKLLSGDFAADTRRRAAQLAPGNTQQQNNLIAIQYELRARVLKQIEAKEAEVAISIGNTRRDLEFKANNDLYNSRVRLINAENQLAKEAYEQQLAFTREGAEAALAFQKSSLEASKNAQLQNLEFLQPLSIQQTLDISKKKLDIETAYLAQGTAVELTQFDVRQSELRRKTLEGLQQRFKDEAVVNELISQVDANGLDERKRIQSKYYTGVEAATQASALEQTKILRDNALSVFDSVKKSTDTVLDQILSKSKSVFGAIGDAIKGAFISTFKSIISSQFAAAVTKLTTGIPITFQTSNLGTGSLASAGNLLSRLSIGKAVATTKVPELPTGAEISPATAQKDAQTALNKYLELELQKPLPIPIPAAPAVDTALQSTLDQLKSKFDSNIFTDLKLEDGLVPVVIKKMEADAASTIRARSAAGQIEEPSLANSDDEEFLGLLKWVKDHTPQAAQRPVATVEDKSILDAATRLGRPRPVLGSEVEAAIDAATKNLNGIPTKAPVVNTSTPANTSFWQQLTQKLTNIVVSTAPGNNTKGVPPFKIEVPTIPVPSAPTIPVNPNPTTEKSGFNIQMLNNLYEKLTGKAFGAPAIPAVTVDLPVQKAPIVPVTVKLPDTKAPLFTIPRPSLPSLLIPSAEAPIVNIPKIFVPPVVVPKQEAPVLELPDFLKPVGGTVPAFQNENKPASSTASFAPSFSLGDFKQAMKEVFGQPDAVTKYSKTGVFFVPGHEDAINKASYDPLNNVIRVFTKDMDQFSTLLHEDVHALLQNRGERASDLNALLPSSALDKANDVLSTRFTSYNANQRADEVLPRLLSGEGGTLGLTQAEANDAVQQLVDNLQKKNKNDLAGTFSSMFKEASANVDYGTPLRPSAGTSLDLLLSGGGFAGGGGFREDKPNVLIPGGGVPQLGITPTFTGQPIHVGGTATSVPFFQGSDNAVYTPANISRAVQFLKGASAYSQASGGIQVSPSTTFEGISSFPSSGGISFSTPPTFAGAPSLPGVGSTGGLGTFGGLSGPDIGINDLPISSFPQNPQTKSIAGIALSTVAKNLGTGLLGQIFNAHGNIYTTPKGGIPQGTTASTIGGFGGALAGFVSSPAGATLGATLLLGGLSAKNRTLGTDVSATAGGALLGGNIGSKIPQVGIVNGAAIGAGVGLFGSGIQRGGVIGLGEDIGGGALAGFGIGNSIGGPVVGLIGAGVGAAVGAVAGTLRLTGLWTSKAEQIVAQIKQVYHLDVDKNFAINNILPIVQQQFGGSISLAIRSPQVRQLLELYGQVHAQNTAGIVNHTVEASFANQGGKLTALPSYINGQATFAGQNTIPSSVASQTFFNGQQVAANFNPKVDAEPSAGGGSGAPAGPSVFQFDEAATRAVLEGRAAAAIQNNPRQVAKASVTGQFASAGRREQAVATLKSNAITS